MPIFDEKAYLASQQAMINDEEAGMLSLLFEMFADQTRLKIMNALFVNELCVGDIALLLNMSTSAISHQLASLKKTRLVRTRKIGKNVFYSMADDHIKHIYQMAYEHIKE